MKTIGLIIAMLFSVASWGATPAKITGLTFGEGETVADITATSLTQYKQLGCVMISQETSGCEDLSIDNAVSTIYQVPAGLKFKVRYMVVGTSGGNCTVNLGSTDAQPALDQDLAAVPGNKEFIIGGQTSGPFLALNNTYKTWAINYEVDGSRFPMVFSNDSTVCDNYIILWGLEEA